MTAVPYPKDRFQGGQNDTAAVAGSSPQWRRELVEKLLGVNEPLQLYRTASSRYERVHRFANVVIASLLLVVAAIPMLLIAIAVKLTSPGPVIYTQVRVGQNRRWTHRERRTDRRQPSNLEKLVDRPNMRRRDRRHAADRRASADGWLCFTMYKFRTMRTDAESGTGAVWAKKNDTRVTPIGNFLRATRLDELPQLINVITGDMNIVGPRPERPQLVTVLAAQIEEYKLRQLAKPGITGLAQISHNYDTCIDDVRVKVKYDLEYLRRRSLREDFRIMARTVPVVLKRLGW